MEQPLLTGNGASETGQRGSERWGSYEYVGRAGSVIPTTSLAGSEVSVDEIRSAASMSVPYSPSLHAPLISSPQSQSQPYEQGLVYQAGYYGDAGETTGDLRS